MKNKIKYIIGLAAILLAGVSAQAQTNVAPPVTVSNLLTSVPAGVTTVAKDGYNVFKNFALTNPISIGVIGVQNGTGKYGGGLEANAVNTNSAVSAGFAVMAIQTQTRNATTGKTSTGFGFYDATLNLSVSQVENVPVLNIPLTMRIFSGPFTSLNGGVLIGEQSGVSGDLNFNITDKVNLDFGGGIINCAGAAAAGLKPVMPMAHVNLTFRF